MESITILHDSRRVKVTNLKAAYCEAYNMIGYDGNDNYKRFWLLSYYQLKVLNGYVPGNKKVINRFSLKSNSVKGDFDKAFDDPKYRGICFVGGGNLSKGSYNYKMRMRNKTGSLAETACRNKVILQLLEFTQTNQYFNGRVIIDITRELNANRYIVDHYDYEARFDTPLYVIHRNILLWLDKYAPKYVTDCIGFYIGTFWTKNRH